MIDSLHIDVLGTGFSIAAEPRWRALLEELWAPFVAEPGPDPLEVAITGTDGAWSLELFGDPAIEETDPWAVADELRYGVVERAVSEAPRFVGLHAGVVVKDELCVLLTGASGAGKTTLTLSLVEEGWSYASDDLAPIEVSTGLVHPFPKPLGIRNPELRELYLGRWEPPDWLPPSKETLLVPPSALPSVVEEPVQPSVLVFPSYEAGTEASMRNVSPAEAVVLCGQFVHDVDRTALGCLSELCKKVPLVGITYGSRGAAAGITDAAIKKVAGGLPERGES